MMITPEEFEKLMKDLAADDCDIEERHSKADGLMMKVLDQLGYQQAQRFSAIWTSGTPEVL